MGLRIYNRNEGSGPWWKTAQWYWGSAAKGWWKLGRSSITNYLEVGLALGGEDNMLQAEIVLPFMGRAAIGVRVPRRLTRGWIYERREWTLRFGYIGRWAEMLFAWDDGLDNMGGYYRGKRERGESLDPWTRAQLWPGIHLTLAPRLRDRVLGRSECVTTTGEWEPTVVPMPEGIYSATVRREDRVWKRKRWPWPSQKRTEWWIEIPGGIPTPGKGENSWDCDDDGIYGTGGSSPSDAVANATRAALRQREKYAGAGWVPREGWKVER